jgi:hypothetical protein
MRVPPLGEPEFWAALAAAFTLVTTALEVLASLLG